MAIADKYTYKDITSYFSVYALGNATISVGVKTMVDIPTRKATHYICFKSDLPVTEPDTVKVFINGTQKFSRDVGTMWTQYEWYESSSNLCYKYVQNCKADGSFAPITIKAEVDFLVLDDKTVTFTVTAPSINLTNPTISNVSVTTTELSIDNYQLRILCNYGHQYATNIEVKTYIKDGTQISIGSGSCTTGTDYFGCVYALNKNNFEYDTTYAYSITVTVPETGKTKVYSGTWMIESDKTQCVCQANVTCAYNPNLHQYDWSCYCKYGHSVYPTKSRFVLETENGTTGFNVTNTAGTIYDRTTNPHTGTANASSLKVGKSYAWTFTTETTSAVYYKSVVSGTVVISGNNNAPTITINSLTINRNAQEFNLNVTMYHPYGLVGTYGNIKMYNSDGLIKSYDAIMNSETAKSYTIKCKFKAGENYTFTVSATANVNEKTETKTVNAICPAKVDAVEIGYNDLVVGTNVSLDYSLINEDGATNFQITSVTYASSDETVATISSLGLITPIRSGYVAFTVTSGDNITGKYPSATKLFYVRSTDGYPFSRDAISVADYLSVPLIQNIINACSILDPDFEYITTVDDFDGYKTRVRGLYDMFCDINANVKALADANEVTYDSILSQPISRDNDGAVWYTLVNEWLRLLSAMAPTSSKYLTDEYGLYSEVLDSDAGGYYDDLTADDIGYYVEV